MGKINSFEKTINLLNSRKDKKVCLIIGCFDILHKGHTALFRFSKKNSDLLIVGLENDKTIKRSKGVKRPLNNLSKRLKNLSESEEIDYVFPIDFVVKFGDKNVSKFYIPILKKIKPYVFCTNIYKDKYWKEKEKIIKNLGINFLKHKAKIDISTTKILKNRNYI